MCESKKTLEHKTWNRQLATTRAFFQCEEFCGAKNRSLTVLKQLKDTSADASYTGLSESEDVLGQCDSGHQDLLWSGHAGGRRSLANKGIRYLLTHTQCTRSNFAGIM